MSDNKDKESCGRHCMVVHAHYPRGEPRVERQAQALVGAGYEVDVICLRGDEEPPVESVDGVDVYRLPVQRHKGRGLAVQLLEYLAFFFLASAKLVALHRRRRYRVVQVHNLPDFLVFAALWPKLRGARVILDLHDLMPEFYAARFSGGLTSRPVRLVRWQERLSCRFADQVITVTDLWRETLIRRGVPAGKVSVVMNVADNRIFFRLPAVERPAGNQDGFNLIYHGTLTRRYGVDLLVRAVDVARREIPHVCLTIHGAGEFREALMQLTEELDLKAHVAFSTRLVPTPELPQIIRKADVGVVPNQRDIFTDGILPTKLMEYVALGIPAIAARTPAIDAYFDETMVQFFTPGDVDDLARCITSLHGNRERLAALARNSDRFNQRYNWAKLGADYVALVERLGNR